MAYDDYFFQKINQKMLPPQLPHGKKMDKIRTLNGGLDEEEMKFVIRIGTKEYDKEIAYLRYEYTDEEKKTINKLHRKHIIKTNKFLPENKK